MSNGVLTIEEFERALEISRPWKEQMMRKMDTRLVKVTVEIPPNACRNRNLEGTKIWSVHAERIDAMVDWLEWAEKQVKQESRRGKKASK